MKNVSIKKNPNADTRTANKFVTKDELLDASETHISNVGKMFKFVCQRMGHIGKKHDWTKIVMRDKFYEQFHNAQIRGEWGHGWYDMFHLNFERHHLLNRVPNDVDLFDVMEQVIDCVVSGMERSGEVREEFVSPDVLVKAYKNTFDKLAKVCQIKE